MDEKCDSGPIVAQSAIRIDSNDTLETLTKKIHREEHKLYPEAFHQKRSTPIGVPCPLEDSLYKLLETAPGLNKPYTKEMLIEGCANIPY